LGTPRDDGFRMPGEWVRHSRCWMAWPCREALWGEGLDEARQVVAAVAQAIAEFEPVTMIVRPDLTAGVSLYVGQGVSVLPMPQDDSWTRDTGPSFLVDGKGGLAGVAWRFNGWGEVYPDHAQDARMAARILERIGCPAYSSRMVLEGGALHVDGEGTALLCAPSVLDPKRNPGMTAEEVEAELGIQLGIDKVIWLPKGLVDDETRGHVESLACFLRPGVVLALASDDPADPNHPVLEANLEVLRAATDAEGRKLEVVTVPQPRARKRRDGRRLTLSYVGFYLANGAVVMPGFADPADKAAYRVISQAFPDRTVVQIDVTELAEGGGGIHSITLGQPVP
jgi:agmatine deiminase